VYFGLLVTGPAQLGLNFGLLFFEFAKIDFFYTWHYMSDSIPLSPTKILASYVRNFSRKVISKLGGCQKTATFSLNGCLLAQDILTDAKVPLILTQKISLL
jgi:hypothetical protein